MNATCINVSLCTCMSVVVHMYTYTYIQVQAHKTHLEESQSFLIERSNGFTEVSESGWVI